jgi:methyl-accepting chemotaxis protein
MPKQTIKKPRAFRSLATILATTFLSLSIAVLLIAGSLQIYFGFQTQRKIIADQQQFITKDAANTVKNFIQEKFSLLKVAAGFGNPIASTEEQRLALGTLLGIEPAFRQLLLVNVQGQELVRVSRISKSLSAQLMDYDKDELFSKLSQKETYVSSIYIDSITSEPMIVMAVPATDVFGDFTGVLVAEVNLKFMWDLIAELRIGDKGTAYVVNKQGDLIAFHDVSRVLRGENLIRLKKVAGFVKSDELIYESTADISKGIEGTYVVANYAHLGEPDWAVVVELPVEEAFETVIYGVGLSFAIIILSSILAIIVGIYLSKRITEPITVLRDTALKIGRGKLDTKIEVGSGKEIGELASAFNQMTNDLKRTTTSIDNLKKEVAERKKAEKKIKKFYKDLKEKSRDLAETKAELESKVIDMERFHKLTMGREEKILELKARIKELEEQLRNKKL